MTLYVMCLIDDQMTKRRKNGIISVVYGILISCVAVDEQKMMAVQMFDIGENYGILWADSPESQ